MMPEAPVPLDRLVKLVTSPTEELDACPAEDPRPASVTVVAKSASMIDKLVNAVRVALEDDPRGIEVLAGASTAHPDLIVIDPHRGLLAIDVHDSVANGGRAEFVNLNRKIDALRADVDADDDLPIARVIAVNAGLDKPTQAIAKRVLVPSSQLHDLQWLELIERRELPRGVLERVRAGLLPNIVFTAGLRRGVTDEGADERAAKRVVLDQQQARIADLDIRNVLVLTGPPGSGKTLVLAARARRLAGEHPDWRIQICCYNKTLIPYLRRLVSEFPNVRVNRVWEVAREFGIRFSFDDDVVTNEGIRLAKRKGLEPALDAVLIDEVQDFRASWLEIARVLLRPDRGGMLIAGDTAQALYHDEDLRSYFDEIVAERLELERPYRSTRQVLSAIQSLDPSFSIAGLAEAPDGPPVELIWAHSWDEQAKCVAFEVNRLLKSGEIEPRDIGILVTKYTGTYGRIQRELDKYEVPYSALAAKEKGGFDLFSNTVKLLTVHSAKGFEFRAVLLFGLETLPDPDTSEPDTLRRGRVAFVGATRAMDTLLITYTRDNKFLTMLSSDEEYVSRYSWPDNYEGVTGG